MSTPSRHVAIRAAAGSGKTFQLTNRLLGLLCSGAQPASVLAATFTRKAAGEILERLMLRLSNAAATQKAADDLAKQLGFRGLERSQLLDLLDRLVQQLHSLRICTLDGLFASLAGGFTLELQLPAGWRIVEAHEDERLRQEAIRAVLRRGDAVELATLLQLLTRGQTTRSVSQQIRSAVDAAYTIFQLTSSEAWRCVPMPARLPADQLQRAVDALLAAQRPRHANWEKAFAKDAAAIAAADWLALLESTLCTNACSDSPTFYKIPIPSDLQRPYRALRAHATAVVFEGVAKQTEATYDLLDHFHREYQRLKAARRALRFEDVTLRLAAAAQMFQLFGAQSDVFFRLDQRTEHLLLDEFQDTSRLQWLVLEPLAKEIAATAEGRSFFCVGDVKQAIYGWRGGESELFDHVGRQLPSLAWRDLAVSYRSAQPVIDLVNQVFVGIGGNAVLAKDAATQAAAEHWRKGFVEHRTARNELVGYVRCIAGPAPLNEETPKEASYRAAADLVAKAISKAPHIEIGVLTRRNVGVARIMEELRHRGVPASQEGGNPITDSTAVLIVLGLLQLADHPGDSAARFLVASTPLGSAVGLSVDSDERAACQVAAACRRRLLSEGYGAAIADWSAALEPHVSQRDRVRLRQLVDRAFVYDASATLRPTDFLRVVESEAVEEPNPAKVRVMTLHQAKGLEFDMVVLPELDEMLVGQTPSLVTWAAEPAGPPVGAMRYVEKAVQQLLPAELQKAFAARIERTAREALCLLYVALTRAKQGLYVIVAPSRENEGTIPRTHAGVMRAALTDGRRIKPNDVWYEAGDPFWAMKR